MAYSDKVLDHYTQSAERRFHGQEQRRSGYWSGGGAGVRRRHEAANQGQSGKPTLLKTRNSRRSVVDRQSPRPPWPPNG